MDTVVGGRTSGSGFPKFLIFIVLLSLIGLMMMTRAHARRHNTVVQNIPDKCNANNYQVHMYRASDGRDAFLCHVEGYFVVSIFNFTKEQIERWGDDEVTSFPRETAQTIDDVIEYMKT